MPRSLDIILRNDAVEMAKAGDKCRFIGTLDRAVLMKWIHFLC